MLEDKQCNIQVHFDGNAKVMVIVSNKYAGQMIGLCGDCDGDVKNDLKTKYGQILRYSPRTKKLVFPKVGDSFAVPDDTLPREHRYVSYVMKQVKTRLLSPFVICHKSSF